MTTTQHISTAQRHRLAPGDLILAGWGDDADLGTILAIDATGERADVSWWRGACRTFLDLQDGGCEFFDPFDRRLAEGLLEERMLAGEE
jgi:hypothetical protein